MKKFNILVVDDEVDLCEILKFNLEKEGYEIDVAHSSEEALKMELSKYHLYVLDIMMGNISGTSFGKMIKKDAALKDKPLVFLTAKDSETDKLIGFNIGADDYIVKPFSVKVLIAKIGAILRRVYPEQLSDGGNLDFGNLVIDNRSKKVIIEGDDVKLTRKEFDIIYLLAKHEGRVFSRSELLDIIWQDEGSITDRTVDVNIRRIRKKFGEYGALLKTRSGYGYIFERR